MYEGLTEGKRGRASDVPEGLREKANCYTHPGMRRKQGKGERSLVFNGERDRLSNGEREKRRPRRPNGQDTGSAKREKGKKRPPTRIQLFCTEKRENSEGCPLSVKERGIKEKENLVQIFLGWKKGERKKKQKRLLQWATCKPPTGIREGRVCWQRKNSKRLSQGSTQPTLGKKEKGKGKWRFFSKHNPIVVTSSRKKKVTVKVCFQWNSGARDGLETRRPEREETQGNQTKMRTNEGGKQTGKGKERKGEEGKRRHSLNTHRTGDASQKGEK